MPSRKLALHSHPSLLAPRFRGSISAKEISQQAIRSTGPTSETRNLRSLESQRIMKAHQSFEGLASSGLPTVGTREGQPGPRARSATAPPLRGNSQRQDLVDPSMTGLPGVSAPTHQSSRKMDG
jgi:hypothetical protein